MQLAAYSSNDASCVRTLLRNSVNYAPETENETIEETEDYFQEAFVIEKDGGEAYVLKDDDGHAESFMTISRTSTDGEKPRWYVTGLFADRKCSAEIAVETVSIFSSSIESDAVVCVNVHPGAMKLIEYWKKNGYSMSPSMSIFSNAKNDRLIAYKR